MGMSGGGMDVEAKEPLLLPLSPSPEGAPKS